MASGMTKTQLVRHLAEKVGTNNKTAATFLEHLTDTAVKQTRKNGLFLTDKAQLGHIQPSHERFDHPTDMGSDESVRPTSLFPCLATDVHHVGGLFTFQTFTRPLHDLYTKLSPGASNQSSHYFKNLGQLRKKTPWTCLERRRLLQFCVEQPVWR